MGVSFVEARNSNLYCEQRLPDFLVYKSFKGIHFYYNFILSGIYFCFQYFLVGYSNVVYELIDDNLFLC